MRNFLIKRPGILIALSFVFAVAMVALPASATCYGTWYDYYDGPNFGQIVGSKVVCSGFPDQVDTDENGNAVETVWYTTQTVVCPCNGGGGGGGGGEDTDDSGDEESSEG